MAQTPPPPGDPHRPQAPPPGWGSWQQPPGYGAPPNPYPGGYVEPGPYAVPVASPAPSNTLALISMIVGIVGAVASCACFVSVPAGVAAVIMGFIGRAQIDRSGGTQRGRGMALAGIITGGIGAAIGLLFIILWLAGTISSNLSNV